MLKINIAPTTELNKILTNLNTSPIKTTQKFLNLVKRPQVGLEDVLKYLNKDEKKISVKFKEEIEISLKYEEFIKKQQEKLKKTRNLEKVRLKKELNYEEISGLRKKVREKLNLIKPINLKKRLEYLVLTLQTLQF